MIDFASHGRHIRDLRIVRGLTQREVAELSGVALSTIFYIERGKPVRLSSIVKVCKGLDTSLNDVQRWNYSIRSGENRSVVHRAAATVWHIPMDLRKRVPVDSFDRIADPAERMRLGRLGLVPLFAGYLDLLMPQGPGTTLIELYDRFPEAINYNLYREAVLQCTHGGARLQIGERVYELEPGDFVGYASEDLQWIEPIGDLPAQEPTLLVWNGAVRVGRTPKANPSRTAVRKPKPRTDSPKGA